MPTSLRLSIMSLILICTACANASDSKLGQEHATTTALNPAETDTTEHCSAYEFNHWTAELKPNAQSDSFTLSLSGEVVLPTPGFGIDWRVAEESSTDSSTLTVHVSFSPPSRMMVQMISEERVGGELNIDHQEFNQVSILCAGKEVALISDVKRAE